MMKQSIENENCCRVNSAGYLFGGDVVKRLCIVLNLAIDDANEMGFRWMEMDGKAASRLIECQEGCKGA